MRNVGAEVSIGVGGGQRALLQVRHVRYSINSLGEGGGGMWVII